MVSVPSSGESAVFIQTRKISGAPAHAKPTTHETTIVRVSIWFMTPSDTNPYALPKVANARVWSWSVSFGQIGHL
ncbi:hypothetical protein T4B_31 [Trichinella pseudospiralis]|uniref:Uncharacterized protein n=2 Tax=Trichinella pseudospiralis TaxID=6337 RepID=A0A0V1IFX5_TRIPS|nr:hypothetical protein T4E_6617 [Trichinella pseudospiralis]KRY85319.1 hypothetical protein T4D_6566 [Trichinella pseudospiralis]KRZ21678.1 hypothetical protein T4B_31 [Trichinella pseudospiralis]